MLRHVVMFRWQPGLTDEAKQAIERGLAGLPGEIPSIVDYRFGPDLGLAEGNWDFVVVADVADVAGYEAYRDHPAHQQLIAELIRPALADRAAVQYELGD